MMHLIPDRSHRGSLVHTAWSSNVSILQVLYSIKTSDLTFHGVTVEGFDDSGDLLWVLEDHLGLRIWQECRQRPFISDGDLGELENEIEEIVGHYEAPTGSIYYAVKWVGYECPTWELEDDLGGGRQITDYCMHLLESC
ncbi:hypothetical protein S40285_08976 [Stachybotrys chlorohalonatus IBT 40285]|uniref:Chromo domain-containing protein n=2 Tax=Stachybotrys TaxID=74721 RepID=A0A084QR58_STAC4|nr:hypothetical protein S7711_10142 [Stachybotrys chartarum IBT 7711]KFA46021.1 hypothetical protein S40293_10080 [Stachybotrys chartarum IBT 40293]KFA66443.1 hypothetical protein S40285_08976 [Stachybotrys chlorohalonata IBT 40285]